MFLSSKHQTETNPSKGKEALESIIRTVLDSKFALLDRPEVEEVVEIKILEVLAECTRNPLFSRVADDFPVEILQKCFSMISQERRSGNKNEV